MIVKRNGNVLFDKVTEANSFWQRFRGLMGRAVLEEGEGLWFSNCSSIHCFFMKIPIDVIYLDKNNRVVGKETVHPWRVGHHYRGTVHLLEVSAGASENIQAGDELQINRQRGKRNE
ncbi:MAG: DUF192 domain-containing protein [Lachnospiraceae bacterium]